MIMIPTLPPLPVEGGYVDQVGPLPRPLPAGLELIGSWSRSKPAAASAQRYATPDAPTFVERRESALLSGKRVPEWNVIRDAQGLNR